MKRCSACGEEKEFAEFAWHRKAKGQLDSYCRDCRAEYKQLHYALNKERYIKNAAKRTAQLTEENVARLLAFLSDKSCVDCGESDPVVLEFDHLRDKLFGIGRALRERSWRVIEAEIAKCDVVCANCHRIRTAARGGWIRARRVAGESPQVT